MKPWQLLLLCAVVLTGCHIEVPVIQSGFIAHDFVTVDSPNKTELSEKQIEHLMTWFAANQSGWEFKIADIYPDTFLYFKHPK